MNIIHVSLFKNLEAYESIPVGLEEIQRLIVHDASVEQKTEQYRQMAFVVSREKANDEVKKKRMPAFCIGVVYNNTGRQAAQIVKTTGLAMCDIDHVERDMMDDIRRKVSSDPHTLMMYETISGEGFRIIFRYDRGGLHINCEAYPAAWKKGNEYFRTLTGCDYDEACSDFSRLSGLAHDAQGYFNFEAVPFTITDEEMAAESIVSQKEPGRPRKVYDTGSQEAEPEQAWPAVQRSLSLRGVTYTPGHRHDYMVLAAYLFNRFGVKREKLTDWAAQEWGDMSAEERDSVIGHCYQKGADEHGTWCVRQSPKGKRHALMSTTEIRAWLSERCQVTYNMVTDQTMVHVNGNGQGTKHEWMVVDERVEESMRCQMEADSGKRVLTKDVRSVLISDFALLVHPVHDFLEGLPEWDGKDRMTELAAHFVTEAVLAEQAQEEAQEAFAWALHKWLVAMVATWMDEGQVNHQIFTIIGEQGIYKTTFFRHLLPPELRSYFWENAHNSFASKDDKLALSENCLVEIEEVDAITGRDMSELKALVTSQTVKERRPYARYRTEKHRLASFCASGNEQRFLTDLTGNRRWLCFKVSAIDNPRQWQMDYQQFYAQLLSEYASGFQFWFDKEEEQRVERMNKPFRIVSLEEQLIASRLRKPRGREGYKLMSSTMIALYLSGGHLSPILSIRKIGDVMHRMGFRVKHRRDGDYFLVVEIPYNETQNYLLKDEGSESDDIDELQNAENEELALPF